jgi:hypothetical protein
MTGGIKALGLLIHPFVTHIAIKTINNTHFHAPLLYDFPYIIFGKEIVRSLAANADIANLHTFLIPMRPKKDYIFLTTLTKY